MPSDPASPVVLVSVPNELEAALIANSLCDRGIQATTAGGYTSGFKAEAPGEVQVLVPVAKLEEARAVLAAIGQGPSDSDSPREYGPARVERLWWTLEIVESALYCVALVAGLIAGLSGAIDWYAVCSGVLGVVFLGLVFRLFRQAHRRSKDERPR